VLVAVAAGAMALASPAAAKTRVVTPGKSIQKAIDKSKPGDTVLVKAGSYAESLQISTNKVTLRGQGKVILTQPTTPATTFCNQQSDSPTKATGVCVVGQVTIPAGGQPEVTKTVNGVKVVGLTVKKFGGDGIFIFGAKRTIVRHNHLMTNGGYGSFANTSSGTKYLGNVSKGNGDAGFYIGDSPKANATVRNNVSIGNTMGVFLRNAQHGKIQHNLVRGNCVGILAFADAPGPSGNWTIRNNTSTANNLECPPTSDGEPAVSGIGIGIAGANDTKVLNNKVTKNKDLHPSFVSGGIVVIKGPGGTAPSNVLVKKNTLSKNSPFDIKWDSSGTVTFKTNTCSTSSPNGLCS
jgi:nitrous oxidase accessory protein NosD